jgi:outer membrane protein
LVGASFGNPMQFNGQPNQSLSVNSSMTLYHGNVINNTITSQNLSLKMSELQVEQNENSIAVSIAQAFLSVLMQEENIKALTSVLETTKIQLTQGKQLYTAGSSSMLDYLQIQSLVAQDEYNVTQAENNLRTDLINLKQILQLPTDYDFKISHPEYIEVNPSWMDLKQAQSLAQNQRAEVKYGQINEDNAKVGLEIAKAGLKPNLSLVGSFSSSYAYGSGTYFSQLQNNLYLPIGLSLGIPILNNRTTKTAVENAKIAIDQAELNLENTKTILNQEIELAFVNLQNAFSQYQSAQKQLTINQKTLDIVNGEMKLGNINYLQLQQQKQQYTQALENYLQAKYSAVLNKQIYDFYAGKKFGLK